MGVFNECEVACTFEKTTNEKEKRAKKSVESRWLKRV